MTKINHTITKVLIANRGEIAVRVRRACDQLGIASAQIASEPDRDAWFARSAHELEVIGPAPARDSYLAADKIVAAARKLGCDAVHPGYGFLSENAAFARKVEEAGLVFIGPRAETIAVMGSKTEARKRVRAFKVPCVPGSEGSLADPELCVAAERIGYPVIIKAAGGGGGRGMRIARDRAQLELELPRARSESLKHFGSAEVYIERFLERPRHVEVQVFGDRHGTVLHLGTRDCSMQRRHQKLIEEAPAPDLSPRMRSAIHAAAVNAAKSVGYENAGTVEFLVEGERFYFLEMNTRIQVEHPVTEVVTGIDLVQLQLKVAQGEKIPFKQSDVRFDGHAIEFRINAEDPENGFRPAAGRLSRIRRPDYPFVREDTGYAEGDQIGLFYDGLISKLVVKGANRADAIAKSRDVLSRYTIRGVPTSLDLDLWATENGVFAFGNVDIAFVEREFTSTCIRDLRARRVKDPAHSEPIGGAEMKNCYLYTSKKHNATYTIEVVHKSDGYFLAIPLDSKGRRARTKNCRMSNGLPTVMRSLIDEVLEAQTPAQVFGN